MVLVEEKDGKEEAHVQGYAPGRSLAVGTASLPVPLEISAVAKEDYYTPAVGVNILQMLQSPMVLMMLASAFMALVLPKLSVSAEFAYGLCPRMLWVLVTSESQT